MDQLEILLEISTHSEGANINNCEPGETIHRYITKSDANSWQLLKCKVEIHSCSIT
jgi:hypothetical protein